MNNSLIATIAPATDVHKPNKRSKPAPAAITCGVIVCSEAPFVELHTTRNQRGCDNHPEKQKPVAR